MSYTINLTAPALLDIQKALTYIALNLQNKTAAYNLYITINSKINNLPNFPNKYPLVNDPKLLYQQIRYIPVDNYLIFYLVNESEQQIQILRFLYAKSNCLAILKHNKQSTAYHENLFEDKHYINEEKGRY
jgi:toxin ParE1/3/4